MAFVLVRAVTYATLFVGFVLVFVPARILRAAGVRGPERVGLLEGAGALLTASAALLALWCVLAFAFRGEGTPAPFDPPRRLVVRGPYGFVRNPMYLGAGLALAGAAAFFGSSGLAGYAALFLAATHAFVLLYEEPRLRRTFGEDYESYCKRVPRWLPVWRRRP